MKKECREFLVCYIYIIYIYKRGHSLLTPQQELLIKAILMESLGMYVHVAMSLDNLIIL